MALYLETGTTTILVSVVIFSTGTNKCVVIDEPATHLTWSSFRSPKRNLCQASNSGATAEFIKSKFEEYGLEPGSDNETYYQTWVQEVLDNKSLKLKNVIGIIPGTDPELKDAPVVISAHYDHLGLGWPDVRKGNEGFIHNGADDNASGIAILLDIVVDLVIAKLERMLHELSNAQIGLVGNQQIQVCWGHVVFGKGFHDHFRKFYHCFFALVGIAVAPKQGNKVDRNQGQFPENIIQQSINS